VLKNLRRKLDLNERRKRPARKSDARSRRRDRKRRSKSSCRLKGNDNGRRSKNVKFNAVRN